mgnify:CR=1 FL=1|jgi:hypothetical protein
MASKAELKEAVERWQKHCETVQQATVVNTAETVRERLARIKRVRADYAAFVEYYFPHYTVNPETGKQTPCAPFHIKAANKVLNERNLKAAFKWHRGAAKSTHLDIFIPLWLKCQEIRQINVMVLVGKRKTPAPCWPIYRPNCNTTSGTFMTSGSSTTTDRGKKASS